MQEENMDLGKRMYADGKIMGIRDHLIKSMLDYLIPDEEFRKRLLEFAEVPEFMINKSERYGDAMQYDPILNKIVIGEKKLESIRKEGEKLRTDGFSNDLVHEIDHWAEVWCKRMLGAEEFDRELSEFRAEVASILTRKFLKGSEWNNTLPQFWPQKVELAQKQIANENKRDEVDGLFQNLLDLVEKFEPKNLKELQENGGFKKLKEKHPEDVEGIIDLARKDSPYTDHHIDLYNSIARPRFLNEVTGDFMVGIYKNSRYFPSTYPVSRIIQEHPEFLYNDEHARSAIEKLKAGHAEFLERLKKR